MNSPKHRYLVVVAFLSLALLVYYGLLRSKHRPFTQSPEARAEVEPAQPSASNQRVADNQAVTPVPEPTAPRETQAPISTLTRDKKWQMAPQTKNVPINFYAKVVDQDERPLSGVRAVISVRQWFYATTVGLSATFPKKEMESDSEGRIQFLDGNGDDLTIESLTKDSYEPDPSALRSFGYNISENIKPDADHPVVLRMWKTGIKEPLNTAEKFITIIPDGRVYTLNLVDGVVSQDIGAAGDLRVWIKRPEGIKFGQRHDWACEIRAVDGGLLSENDGYASMSLAPTDGYQSNFELARSRDAEQWGDSSGRRRFYLKTRNGRVFGRMEIEMFSVYSPSKPESRLWIKYAINPAGSRILR